MDAGIVGLPNVGKSTLFNALTKAGAHAANYPFATVEPNVGIVAIPDPRLNTIASFIETKAIIQATLRLIDIAGLVRGASKGEGLGNQFLGNIREVDAIVHVVRCFETALGGEDVAHVDGPVDPVRDIETVETELILADLQTVETAIPKAERNARSRDPEAIVRLEVLRQLEPVLAEGTPARTLVESGKLGDADHVRAFKSLGILSAKRVLYVANVDEVDLQGEGAHASRVRALAAKEGMEVVPVCAKIEAELAELESDDQMEVLESLGLTEPALHSVAHGIYALLHLQSFYTAGPKQVRAWPVPLGTPAPQGAGTIHTDFQRGFIRAEVFSVDDLIELKTERAIKEAGRMRIEGKDYVLQDADVCHFLFNV